MTDVDLSRLQQALAELKSFVAEPVRSNRDRAGIIQAFEFTFELFWRAFQKIGESNGMPPRGPKTALKNAFSLGVCRKKTQDRGSTKRKRDVVFSQHGEAFQSI